MKNLFLGLTVSLVLAIGCSAQQTIRWGDSSLQHGCCTEYFLQDHLVTEFRNSDLYFSTIITTKVDEDYYAVWFVVLNKSGKSILTLPETFKMRLDFGNNKVQEINAESIDKVEERIGKRGGWRSALGSMLAGMSTQGSTITGPSGTYTVTSPDYAAQNRARGLARERAEANRNKAAQLSSFALRKNTVFKDDIVSGLVFFRVQKGVAPNMVLSFTLGDTVYEIPYGPERTKIKLP